MKRPSSGRTGQRAESTSTTKLEAPEGARTKPTVGKANDLGAGKKPKTATTTSGTTTSGRTKTKAGEADAGIKPKAATPKPSAGETDAGIKPKIATSTSGTTTRRSTKPNAGEADEVEASAKPNTATTTSGSTQPNVGEADTVEAGTEPKTTASTRERRRAKPKASEVTKPTATRRRFGPEVLPDNMAEAKRICAKAKADAEASAELVALLPPLTRLLLDDLVPEGMPLTNDTCAGLFFFYWIRVAGSELKGQELDWHDVTAYVELCEKNRELPGLPDLPEDDDEGLDRTSHPQTGLDKIKQHFRNLAQEKYRHPAVTTLRTLVTEFIDFGRQRENQEAITVGNILSAVTQAIENCDLAELDAENGPHSWARRYLHKRDSPSARHLLLERRDGGRQDVNQISGAFYKLADIIRRALKGSRDRQIPLEDYAFRIAEFLAHNFPLLPSLSAEPDTDNRVLVVARRIKLPLRSLGERKAQSDALLADDIAEKLLEAEFHESGFGPKEFARAFWFKDRH